MNSIIKGLVGLGIASLAAVKIGEIVADKTIPLFGRSDEDVKDFTDLEEVEVAEETDEEK